MIDLLQELSEAVHIALKGRKMEDLSSQIAMGADGTPTQEIDKIAENAILECLEKHGNPLNVLSEEAGIIDNGAENTLVIDPVDGTFNALVGIPFYSVSLAVGKQSLSDVQFGLIRDLVHGAVYIAEKGKGAYMDGQRLKTKDYDPGKTVFLVYLGESASPMSFEIASKARRTRNYGAASLELAMVASGVADLYMVDAEPMIRLVDLAAGVLLLREAGGEIYNTDGDVLDMKFGPRERSNFIAVGDKKVLEGIV
ncbi:MAG: inositol monophosphatase [Methanobacteriota archaeon]|nr:MAG: inositol monophosphatase [Euryarchaeota archaeon]